MRLDQAVSVLILTEDVNGVPVEVHFDAAYIEEIEMAGYFGEDMQTFTIRPLDNGSLRYTPAAKHRKPKHAKETP